MKRENTGEKSGKSWEKVRWAKIEKKKKSIFGNLKDHRSFLSITVSKLAIDRKPKN